jgi:hypothetical protein
MHDPMINHPINLGIIPTGLTFIDLKIQMRFYK